MVASHGEAAGDGGDAAAAAATAESSKEEARDTRIVPPECRLRLKARQSHLASRVVLTLCSKAKKGGGFCSLALSLHSTMATSTTASSTSAPRAGGVTVVDSYDEARPLIEGGVRAFARATLAVAEGQVAGATAELAALQAAAGQAEAAYAALAASAPAELRAFSAQHAAQVAALRPHLAALEQLATVVAGLGAAASTLDQQTRQLEGAVGDVLG